MLIGVPVCRETLSDSVDSAADEANKIGFPVVLKACGANLFHKTELGGIALTGVSEITALNLHNISKLLRLSRF